LKGYIYIIGTRVDPALYSDLAAPTFGRPPTLGPREPTRLHQLNAIFAILGASDRDKSLDLHGWGLRKRL
jgi:hypothetical protein